MTTDKRLSGAAPAGRTARRAALAGLSALLATAVAAGPVAASPATLSATSATAHSATAPRISGTQAAPAALPQSVGKPALGDAWTPPAAPVPAGAAAGQAPVMSMATPPVPLPSSMRASAGMRANVAPPAGGGSGSWIPTNYALATSLQSFLNAGGVDAVGAYQQLGERYGQLPGTGEIITNVSIGDLTDQSMVDAGDAYVAAAGPTTIVRDGQRYLDLPSMPLIPTYVADSDGHLDPTGSTENQDTTLGEVMLDFGVMAPLPHDRQRPGAVGDGVTDLLGIAPGAQYRLVVPQEPTIDQVGVALRAAANQQPRPDVITASLGFGTDANGFPGRYLEDDPAIESIIAGIVREGIVVCVSSNDGTRLYTPTAVGPDGGATPTDLATNAKDRTDIDDDAYSTTPSRVLDSGAIAAGASTLDDTIAGGPATVAETRINGGSNFASGFGSRVDLSAPGDGIVAFEHTYGGAAQDVTPVLSGGTSASAPEIAAAAAVVLQAARLTGRHLSPAQVRSLLAKTGRAVPTSAQIDRTLQVGPQVDVSAAVASLLPQAPHPDIVRVSVAHRQTIGDLGGEFLENSDPGTLDLAGPDGTGEGLVGPVTFGIDAVGVPGDGALNYTLTVGDRRFHASVPAIRLLPADLLAAVGLPVVSTQDRQVGYTVTVGRGGKVLASASGTLSVGPTDGGYDEALAPTAPSTVDIGATVTVHYDLTGVRVLADPQLVVSTVGHWNPVSAPLFNAGYTVPLTDPTGTVTIPASAFHGGGGLYGIGIAQESDGPQPVYGEFTPIRVVGGSAATRPGAPTLATRAQGTFGHQVEVSRAKPAFAVRYDTHGIANAAGAVLEISAPSPTVWNSLNTFTNANGTGRDDDGATTGSSVYRRLAAGSGTVSLNALDLGLPTAMSYDVRVLATDRDGNVLGQASGSSLLIVDDGLIPGGGTVDSFGIAGKDSVVAVHDGTGARLLRYDAASGTYGAALAHDTDPDGRYEVVGADAGAHRALAVHWNWNTLDVTVQTYDTRTGALVGQFPLAGDAYAFLAGRVDPVRHRAALLAWHQPDGADTVLPVDLTDGSLGAPIPVDAAGVRAGNYSAMDLDASTGQVFLAHLGGSLLCLGGTAAGVVRVDLGTGAVTPSGSVPTCAYGFASDGQGGNAYQISYRSISVNLVGTTSMTPVSETGLVPGDGFAVRQQSGLGLAVDGAHQVGMVAFGSPQPRAIFGVPGGQLSDSNSTAQFATVDLATGTVTGAIGGFNFQSGFGGQYNPTSERSVQLDPATRTGWTFGPGASQIHQFRY